MARTFPRTLYRLARSSGDDEEGVYAKVAGRLGELIPDVRGVDVDLDEKREELAVLIRDESGTTHFARALSDGSLRFLALVVLDLDPMAEGVLCLEEPENGIHPGRIPAMLQLLKDIATDATEAMDEDAPLRQVVINTHSPAVVMQVDDDDLVIAESREAIQSGRRFQRVGFGCLPGTWRNTKPPEGEKARAVSLGVLGDYLNPNASVFREEGTNGHSSPGSKRPSSRRVADRPDLQPFLTNFPAE